VGGLNILLLKRIPFCQPEASNSFNNAASTTATTLEEFLEMAGSFALLSRVLNPRTHKTMATVMAFLPHLKDLTSLIATLACASTSVGMTTIWVCTGLLFNFAIEVLRNTGLLRSTGVQTGSGIDPRKLWKPTDLERALTWNLTKTIPDVWVPRSHASLGQSHVCVVSPQSLGLSQEFQGSQTIGAMSSSQYEQPPGSTTGEDMFHEMDYELDYESNSSQILSSLVSSAVTQIICEVPNCLRTFERTSDYK
jgi:hypothetical protein